MTAWHVGSSGCVLAYPTSQYENAPRRPSKPSRSIYSASHRCMGKAISLPRPLQPAREAERDSAMMELRKRSRPPRIDPDFVSSPPLLPPRKRARRQAAAKEPVEPAHLQPLRMREPCAAARTGCPMPSLHRATCGRQALRRTSKRVSSRPLHPFNWYEPDMWTEVAKHLCGFDLIRLSLTCRWFLRFIADDSIWRHAFFRDLDLTVASAQYPRPPHLSWRKLYFAPFNGCHAYSFRQSDKHLGWWRVGAFLLDSPQVLVTGKLPVPRWLPPQPDGVQLAIQMMGACVLNNARPGIWIADMHLERCPLCNLSDCKGTMQVLDARHSELFFEKAYLDGTFEFEEIGNHFSDEEKAAQCGVFNYNRLATPPNAGILDANSWIGKRTDQVPRMCATTYAAAVNTNLKPKQGLLSKFQAMQDTTRDGQIVSIRISQVLL